jgi:dihydrofolate synthase/folylpolyglutamate synthase
MEYSPEFREVLDLIYSFTMNGRKQQKLRVDPRPPSLEVMWSLMEFLNQPQQAYPVIHIAGTKGKGSTANFVANTLTNAGYKVGLYTSPHLHDFSERIQIDGCLIPHETVAAEIEKMKPFFELQPEINTFEIITAIAFQHFRTENIDIAVVEVGLGGRFDATNVVNPILSIITSISFDHMDLLGDTLEKIAFEKAGIIKPGIPVVIGKQTGEVKDVLFSVAEERKAPVIDAVEVSVGNVQSGTNGHKFRILGKIGESIELTIPLIGLHQIENATIAYTAICKLVSLGYKIPISEIQKGFSTVNWPARFEVISTNPLVIADGAHNVDSMGRVLETLQLVVPLKKPHFLFGVSKGKDVEGMLRLLLPETTTISHDKIYPPKIYGTSCAGTISRSFGLFLSIDIEGGRGS